MKKGKRQGSKPVAGKNEPLRPLKVLIAIPSHGDCKAGFLHSVTRAAIHFTSLPYDGSKEVDVTIVKSSLLPEGRARLVARAYDFEATHILFVDTDMKFPPDTIARLLNHNLACVGVNYPRKNMEARPTAYLDSPDYVGPVWSGENATGIQEVSVLGFGCVLIDMRVFDKLDLPFFAIEPQAPEFVKHVGEDVYFCRKLHKAGIPVHIDHDLSKQIAHIGDFEYTNFLSKEAEVVKQALYKEL
jgi:hypothetical protein